MWLDAPEQRFEPWVVHLHPLRPLAQPLSLFAPGVESSATRIHSWGGDLKLNLGPVHEPPAYGAPQAGLSHREGLIRHPTAEGMGAIWPARGPMATLDEDPELSELARLIEGALAQGDAPRALVYVRAAFASGALDAPPPSVTDMLHSMSRGVPTDLRLDLTPPIDGLASLPASGVVKRQAPRVERVTATSFRHLATRVYGELGLEEFAQICRDSYTL